MANTTTLKRDHSTSPELESIAPEQLESDEWKGLTDPKERRRRQNRVNQRAYRGFHAFAPGFNRR